MRQRILRRLAHIVFVVVLIFPAYSQQTVRGQKSATSAGDEAVLRDLTKQYFEALISKEPDKLGKLVGDSYQTLAERYWLVQKIFGSGNKVVIDSFTINKISIRDGMASVFVTVNISLLDPKTGRPSRILSDTHRELLWTTQERFSSPGRHEIREYYDDSFRFDVVSRNMHRIDSDGTSDIDNDAFSEWSRDAKSSAFDKLITRITRAPSRSEARSIAKEERWVLLSDDPDLTYLINKIINETDGESLENLLSLEPRWTMVELERDIEKRGTEAIIRGDERQGFVFFRLSKRIDKIIDDRNKERKARRYQELLDRDQVGGDNKSKDKSITSPHAADDKNDSDPPTELPGEDPFFHRTPEEDEAWRFYRLGLTHYQYGNYDKAAEAYAKSLELFAKTDQYERPPAVAQLAGDSYLKQRSYARAIEFYLKSLHYSKAVIPKEKTERRRGGDSNLGDYEYDETPGTLRRIGYAYLKLREYDEALKYYKLYSDYYDSLIRKAARERDKDFLISNGLMHAVSSIANVYEEMGDDNALQQHYLQAAGRLESLGRYEDAADLIMGIATLYAERANFTTALQYLDKCLPLYEQAGDDLKDKETIPLLHFIIGFFSLLNGNNSVAASHLQTAQDEFRAIKPEPDEYPGVDVSRYHEVMLLLMQTLAGGVYASQGDDLLFQDAKRKLEGIEGNKKTLERVWAYGTSASDTLKLIGDFYKANGDHLRALECYNESLSLLDKTEDQRLTNQTFRSIIEVYEAKGDGRNVLNTYQKYVDFIRQAGNPKEQQDVLLRAARIYKEHKEYSRALELFLESSRLIAPRDSLSKTFIFSDIADTYLLLGENSQALEFAHRAIGSMNRNPSPLLSFPIYNTAGKVYQAVNKPEEARKLFQDAIDAVEGIRLTAAGSSLERQFFYDGDNIKPFHSMISLLVRLQDNDEAIKYAEFVKGRVLADIMASGRTESSLSMTLEERREDQKLRNEITLLGTQLRQVQEREPTNQMRLNSLSAALDRSRTEHEIFRLRILATHPELQARPASARPPTLEEMNDRILEPESAIAEYVVTDEEIYLFLIAHGKGELAKEPQAKWKVYTLPINKDEINNRVKQFLQELSEKRKDFKDDARKLYDLLLGPAWGQLGGTHHITIVPDGPLWNLPFQALLTPEGHYLMENSAISYAPSVVAIRDASAKRERRIGKADTQISESRLSTSVTLPQPTVLAIGNPSLRSQVLRKGHSARRGSGPFGDLPDAEEEARSVAELYGSTSDFLNHGRATEEVVKRVAGRYNVLHFATHGLLNDASPMYSQLVLAAPRNGSEDGLLEAREVTQMNLHADLAVLSACETARGKIGAGEGLIGLTWAFFAAGVPTTVASQWKVDSKSTTELMVEFHKQLKPRLMGDRTAPGPAESLRRAALKLMRTEEYSHPFYWAGFVVVGDGR